MAQNNDDFRKERARQIRKLRSLGQTDSRTGQRKSRNSSQINKRIDPDTGEVSYVPGTLKRNWEKSPGGFNPNTRGTRGTPEDAADSISNAFDQPDMRGDLVSLKVEINFNEKSWSSTVAEIKALENFFHMIDVDQDFYEATGVMAYPKRRGGLTHFRGVYSLMNKMAERALTAVPPLWPAWKGYVSSMNAANFGLGGLPVGGWAPYDAEYAAIAGPKPDLVRTGMLSFSLTSGLLVENVRGDSVEFGTRVEYAKFHQYGTTRMPARKIVFEPEGAAKFFGGFVGRWVARERVSLEYESIG